MTDEAAITAEIERARNFAPTATASLEIRPTNITPGFVGRVIVTDAYIEALRREFDLSGVDSDGNITFAYAAGYVTLKFFEVKGAAV